eukprot:4640394-Prymnesium_polylepis.1
MAHEIGHLLGLGHPDAALRLSEPQNSYHMDLAERRPWNSSNCLNPWENTEYGFPADAVVSSKGIRPSVMEEFSQHNPVRLRPETSIPADTPRELPIP